MCRPSLEKWSKRQGWNVSISLQCFNITFSLPLRIRQDQQHTSLLPIVTDTQPIYIYLYIYNIYIYNIYIYIYNIYIYIIYYNIIFTNSTAQGGGSE